MNGREMRRRMDAMTGWAGALSCGPGVIRRRASGRGVWARAGITQRAASVMWTRAGIKQTRAGVIKSRGSRAGAGAERGRVLPSADVLFARVGRPAGVRAGTEGSPR